MNDFQANDKVVCVDDKGVRTRTHVRPSGVVKRGQIYFVLSVINDGRGLVILGKPTLWKGALEIGWKRERFRKLGEVKFSTAETATEAQP